MPGCGRFSLLVRVARSRESGPSSSRSASTVVSLSDPCISCWVAALDVASGHVITDMTQRHRAIEAKKFLNLINRTVPQHLDIHIVLDNVSTHKTPAIQQWIQRNPRFTFHFTPTYSSWMNLIERWFAELTNKWLRRGTHHSVKDLTTSIRTWTANWNNDPKPFVWHKTADQILDTLAAYCHRISD